MIKVGVPDPDTAGTTFGMEYYCRKHIPMVQQQLRQRAKVAVTTRPSSPRSRSAT